MPCRFPFDPDTDTDPDPDHIRSPLSFSQQPLHRTHTRPSSPTHVHGHPSPTRFNRSDSNLPQQVRSTRTVTRTVDEWDPLSSFTALVAVLVNRSPSAQLSCRTQDYGRRQVPAKRPAGSAQPRPPSTPPMEGERPREPRLPTPFHPSIIPSFHHSIIPLSPFHHSIIPFSPMRSSALAGRRPFFGWREKKRLPRRRECARVPARSAGAWRNWLAHRTVDPEVAGSSPVAPAISFEHGPFPQGPAFFRFQGV